MATASAEASKVRTEETVSIAKGIHRVIPHGPLIMIMAKMLMVRVKIVEGAESTPIITIHVVKKIVEIEAEFESAVMTLMGLLMVLLMLVVVLLIVTALMLEESAVKLLEKVVYIESLESATTTVVGMTCTIVSESVVSFTFFLVGKYFIGMCDFPEFLFRFL